MIEPKMRKKMSEQETHRMSDIHNQWLQTNCAASLALKMKLENSRIKSARSSNSTNQTTMSNMKVVTESNSLLRNKLKDAEESLTFMVGKLKQTQKQLILYKENSQTKDLLIKQLTQKVECLSRKYRSCKKSLIQSQEERSECQNIKQQQHSQCSDMEMICQRYWKELRNSCDKVAQLEIQNHRLTEENVQLTLMTQSAKQQLYRMTNVIAHTTTKLEDIANEKNSHKQLCQRLDRNLKRIQETQNSDREGSPLRPILKPGKAFGKETPPTILPLEANTDASNSSDTNNPSRTSINILYSAKINRSRMCDQQSADCM